MKVRLFLTVLAVLSFITYSRSTCAQGQTSGNFYYPTGSINFRISTRWLAADCDGSGEYITRDGDQKYHVGVDIVPTDRDQVVGSPVYAIADGVVDFRSPNGWGKGNVGIIVKHKLSSAIEFLAVYGHIVSSLDVGDSVIAGKPFATIGSYSSPHLHFGIQLFTEPDIDTAAGKGWGIMSCSNWPDRNGFENPIAWIETQKSSSTVPPLDQQAKQEVVKRDETSLILGSWKDENSVIKYFKDSTFISNADTGEKHEGTWSISEGVLTLRFNTSQHPYLYKILEISTSTYKISGISGDKNVYNARRIEPTKQSPVYISKDSRVYHHDRNCSNLTTTDGLMEFSSPQNAEASGGILCEHCDPSAVNETSIPSYNSAELKSRENETQNEETNHTDTNSDKSKLIIGSWINEVGMVEYFKDGTYRYDLDTGEKDAGVWNINGDILAFRSYNNSSKTPTFKILELSTSTYKIVGIDVDKRTYNATRKTPIQQSVYYSSVVFSLLECTYKHNGVRRIVRGDVPLSIDLSSDTIVKQILEDARLFAQEKCPIKKRHRTTAVQLYQLDEKYPQFKDYSVIDATAYWSSPTWHYKNKAASIANEKLDIAKKEEANKRLNEFISKYGGQEWPSPADLRGNPFVYEGKTVGIRVKFNTMETASVGYFEGCGQFILETGVGIARVSNIPKGLFKTPNTAVLLVVKVLGRTEGGIAINYKFVDAYFCKNSKGCSCLFPD